MSKIEVDQITQQSGTTITVGGGACKTAVVDATTVTLGRCGGSVALASGASQSGFGRTGTVDWQTGSIKTGTFTAANGEGYFADTSSGAFTMNLPAGTAGNIVSVVDYTNTFQTNALTISPNGSQKIGGFNTTVSLTTEGQSVTFVYVDDTEGWKNVQDSTSNIIGNPFLSATGGTETTCGNDKIHTFTSPGTFTVSKISTNCASENTVSYMVIAGGGGGSVQGGGAGAGGYREVKTPLTPYTASPLDGYATPGNRITVTATGYPITVGAGGAGACFPSPRMGAKGSDSIFSSITSAGGGGGKGYSTSAPVAAPGFMNGGSGGGGASGPGSSNPAGTGNTPPVTPSQGNNGGSSSGDIPSFNGAGGGGATAAGTNSPGTGGGTAGGAGATSSITGSPVGRAGGGGGGGWQASAPGPASDGGGAGGSGSSNAGVAGTTNTGGGGGSSMSPDSGSYYAKGGNGGSGIVVIRYKFQ
jgi:hypothetical protein